MRTIQSIVQLSLLLVTGWPALAAQLPAEFKLVNAETVFYPEGSIQPIARCKVEAVFKDHSKFGFFQVKLFPILVMQGVRIELGEGFADDEWMHELGANFSLGSKTQAVEWREVDLTSSRTNSPHLHAQSARLRRGKEAVFCHLENCSIEWRGQHWQAGRVNWQTAHARQQLTWRTDAGVLMHWDLSTGEIATND